MNDLQTVQTNHAIVDAEVKLKLAEKNAVALPMKPVNRKPMQAGTFPEC